MYVFSKDETIHFSPSIFNPWLVESVDMEPSDNNIKNKILIHNFIIFRTSLLMFNLSSLHVGTVCDWVIHTGQWVGFTLCTGGCTGLRGEGRKRTSHMGEIWEGGLGIEGQCRFGGEVGVRILGQAGGRLMSQVHRLHPAVCPLALRAQHLGRCAP